MDLEAKLNALINLRTQLLAPKTKESTLGDTPTKSNAALKPMNPNARLANVTEDLVFEILKYRLPHEVVEGVVIESLESVWIGSRLNALTYLLKAAGNIKEIFLVLVLNSYEKHMKMVNDQQNEEGTIINFWCKSFRK